MEQIDIPPEMIQKYLQRRIVDLEMLEQNLTNKDARSISGIAHQIKGNALSFGFQSLNDIAIKLETASKAIDWEQMTELVRQYREWLNSALRK